MRFRYLTLLLLAFGELTLPLQGFSQVPSRYTPEAITDTIPAELQKAFVARMQADQASLRETDPSTLKYIKQLYKERTDYVISAFNADYFMLNSEITEYLQQILENIYHANPQLPREARIYGYRSDAINAMSFGEGTIGFSLGLLSRLTDESEAAFVICHELVHYHLKHSDQKIRRMALLKNNAAVNRQVRQIARSDYDKFTRFNQLRLTLEADAGRHGREHEFEADSIALEWFLNTQYNREGPVRLLQLLDTADANDADVAIDYRERFSFSAYPFREKWLTRPVNDLEYANREKPDSLRTHPDCEKRIAVLKRRLSNVQHGHDRNADDGQRFKSIVRKAQYELAASLYHFEQYGKALYHYLQLSSSYQDDLYGDAMIAINLHRLYSLRRNHQAAGAIELPDPRFAPEYNNFLHFIHALRTSELGALGYWYAVTKRARAADDELMLFTTWLASDTETTQADRDRFRAEYLARFPKGQYRLQMENK